MTILTTARLRLEPFDDHHLEGLHAMNRLPEVMRLPLAQVRTLPTAAFADLASAAQAYAQQAGVVLPTQACIAMWHLLGRRGLAFPSRHCWRWRLAAT